ncbi:MAG: succinate--CoA ligase subunit beta [Caedibacter sp. 38-128]|nr:ADP-forming succinate--CoA ligase subunit beta [Holosporales bacterium]OJX05194.1 MAG: succinate--CoA ligase subunit beta [Caedibacter sp. 38-128]
MKIHEYQAKELLSRFGVLIPQGQVASTPEEAEKAAHQLGGQLWAVKAQIHAGGRGKGGGVKLAKTKEQVKEYAQALLGSQLVTPQTGPAGQLVRRIYVEQGTPIAKEFYFSILLDRASSKIMLVFSEAGGTSIEEVAAHDPTKIFTEIIDPLVGFQPFNGRRLAFSAGIEGKTIPKIISLMEACYNAFVKLDATLVEINPLIITTDGDPLALDAKMMFDDNSLFKHPDIEQLRDLTEEEPTETEAAKNSLSYIKLEGNIGCMVNGAGLAMATMDVIKLYGGEPANFLDVGGGAPRERVIIAFKLILSDPHVKAILVNIFGGIMRCDIIAEGIVAAARDVQIHVPLIVRLEGTNVEQGKEILAQSGLSIIAAEDLADAAQKSVAAVRGVA